VCRPLYGANIGATINIDLTDKVRRKLLKEIEARFNLKNPILAPVVLSNVKAKSLLIETLSTSEIKQNISGAFQFGQNVGFEAGSKGFDMKVSLKNSSGREFAHTKKFKEQSITKMTYCLCWR
jgi:hypothetical protein